MTTAAAVRRCCCAFPPPSTSDEGAHLLEARLLQREEGALPASVAQPGRVLGVAVLHGVAAAPCIAAASAFRQPAVRAAGA